MDIVDKTGTHKQHQSVAVTCKACPDGWTNLCLQHVRNIITKLSTCCELFVQIVLQEPVVSIFAAPTWKRQRRCFEACARTVVRNI